MSWLEIGILGAALAFLLFCGLAAAVVLFVMRRRSSTPASFTAQFAPARSRPPDLKEGLKQLKRDRDEKREDAKLETAASKMVDYFFADDVGPKV